MNKNSFWNNILKLQNTCYWMQFQIKIPISTPYSSYHVRLLISHFCLKKNILKRNNGFAEKCTFYILVFSIFFCFVLFHVSMEDDHIFLFFFFSRIEEKKIRAWPIEQFFTQCCTIIAQKNKHWKEKKKKKNVSIIGFALVSRPSWCLIIFSC